MPLAVVGGHTFEAVAAGDDHTCAITTGGQAFCWGRNEFGQLGVGPIGFAVSEPTAVAGSQNFVGTPTASGLHTCAMTAEADVYCWGHNGFGQLGHDPVSLEMSDIPVLVPWR
jgi:alpha-tubulin suppressor-like RCC1 family protein